MCSLQFYPVSLVPQATFCTVRPWDCAFNDVAGRISRFAGKRRRLTREAGMWVLVGGLVGAGAKSVGLAVFHVM